MTITGTGVLLFDLPLFQIRNPDGILGTELLKTFIIQMDATKRVFRFLKQLMK